jgi:hypothetical protein
MKRTIALVAATAMSLAPASVFAKPATTSPPTLSPAHETGQPGADCEDLVADGLGTTPGNSSTAPGSAFNPDGNAGTHYAGEQPQNSRNTASVSQYDTACLHQPL